MSYFFSCCQAQEGGESAEEEEDDDDEEETDSLTAEMEQVLILWAFCWEMLATSIWI